MTDFGEQQRIGAEFGRVENSSDPFAAAVRATRMPMVITNPHRDDNPIVFVNDAFVRLTGYARDEILGRNCRFLQGSETDLAEVNKLKQAIRARTPIELDLLNYRKNGSTFWNRLVVAPVFDRLGELTHFFASQLDVTDERERLRDLGAAVGRGEQVLDALIRSSSEVRFRMNVDWSSLQQLAGGNFIADTATADSNWLETYVPAEDRKAVQAEIARAIGTRSTYLMEHRVNRVDGTVGWAFSRAVPLFDGTGEITDWFGAASDITDRKKAEAALTESEARLRAVVSTVPIGIVMADADGAIYGGNARAEEIVGHSILQSRDTASYGEWISFHPDGRRVESHEYPLARVYAGEERPELECRYQRGDGRHAWTRIVGTPVRDRTGRLTGGIVALIDIDLQKRAEEDLRAGEAYWRELFERLSEGFMVVELVRDTGGQVRTWRFVELNPAWERISGLSRAAALGRTLDEVIPGAEPVWVERYAEIAETGQPQAFQMPLRTLNQCYDIRAFRVGPDRVGVLFQEVSGRNREEMQRAALLHLAERLRDLSDPAEMAYAAAEIMGKALGVDRAGYATMRDGGRALSIERDWTAPGFHSGAGWHRTEHFGRAVTELASGYPIVIGDTMLDSRTAQQGVTGFNAYEIRSVVNHPVLEDGRFVAFFYVNSGTVRAWTPDEVVFVGSAAEHTRISIERRTAEAALRRMNETLEVRVAAALSERKLWADVVASSDAMIAALSPDLRFLALNEVCAATFEACFGSRPQVGDRLDELLAQHTRYGAQTMVSWRRAFCGEPVAFAEEFGDPALRRVTLDQRFNPLHDEAGRLIGATLYAVDITSLLKSRAELATVQEALRQSQKMEAVGQLTGGVAHDFNNLLTVIRSSTEMLMQPTLSEARRARYLSAISDTVGRAAKLTGQLLAFARRQALMPEVFDARERVRSLADMMETLTGSRVRISVMLAMEDCFVNVDPSQFDTALVNVVANARDAMDGVGQLTITVRVVDGMPAVRSHPSQAGPFVAVSITDTGRGVAPDDLERIFEPFFTTKGVGKGTGLGLSQVFGFAKQSGGEVTVRSEVGKGTIFTLYLPRGPGHATVAATVETRSLLPAGHDAGVLLVEDNSDVGASARQALADLGYRVVLVSSAEEALAELVQDAGRFDVVFSDVVMPGMDGIALGQEIRRLYRDLPVILTSGYSHVLAQNGTYGFKLLHKPYSIEQVTQALREAAAWRHQTGDKPRR